MTLIEAFEVRPADDEAFAAAWEAARDGVATATLYRALRDDVALRFVELARAAPAGARRELPFRSHAAVYETAGVDGAPDGDGGVVRIEPFELSGDGDGDDERLVAGWEAARATVAAQRGYLGARLHRSLGPAGFRFVEVARWSSPLMVARALQRPEFRAAALPFPSQPALYLAVSG